MLNRLLNIYRRIFWSYERYAEYIGVKVGKRCKIATRDFGSEPYLIEIGDHVQITNDVRFLTHGAGWVFRDKFPRFDTFGKIKIGNNVYIGNGAMIMPGVCIGDNVIIGAGTVVTKSIANNCIVAGNPGKVIGNIHDLEQRLIAYNVDTKLMDVKEKRNFLQSLEDSKFIKK